MTTSSGHGQKPFRLSQLLYDTRYRSITIQVFAICLIAAILYWLGLNLIENLKALGKDFDFSFLGTTAGYDINQRLIDYTSQSSHGRAAIVGILNTLLVAFLGCITATIIGVIAGVLRLSKNWIVNRLMAVYVEGFRNIPLLLWILLIYAIFSESASSPRDFKVNAEGVSKASMLFGDSVAITNRGVYVPNVIWGEGSTILAVVFILSLVFAFVYRRYAKKVLFDTGRALPMVWPAFAIAFVPSILMFFALGQPLSLSYPELGGFNFKGGLHLRTSLIALWFALSLYTGAFIAEIVRAGILSVSKGQSEAASALGIKPGKTMSLIILPQAMRVIIPPLISQFLNLTKNSSLALAVGYMDVRATLGGITINQTGRELEGMLLIGLFYLAISLIISVVMNAYNSSIKLKER